MTTPEELYSNVVSTMEYLDTVLPNGSHVLLTGLANGSILFDSLGDRIYPLGRVKNDVTNSDVKKKKLFYLKLLKLWLNIILIIDIRCTHIFRVCK